MSNSHTNARLSAEPATRNVVMQRVAVFEPRGVIRCKGAPVFRTQAARDIACLLDVDPHVVSWTCQLDPLVVGTERVVPDLSVNYGDRTELVVAISNDVPPPSERAVAVAKRVGHDLIAVHPHEIEGDRLENAKELLRYARWRVSLSDRVRLLALLDQEGSLSLIECMSAVRNGTDPIGAVAALALKRFVEVDLDAGLLCPETRVTRFRG